MNVILKRKDFFAMHCILVLSTRYIFDNHDSIHVQLSVTSMVYFVGRDIYATIVFHNFQALIGVMLM